MVETAKTFLKDSARSAMAHIFATALTSKLTLKFQMSKIRHKGSFNLGKYPGPMFRNLSFLGEQKQTAVKLPIMQ